MKWKEIEEEVRIHCPEKQNAIDLLEHFIELGYTWSDGTSIDKQKNKWNIYYTDTYYFISVTGIMYGSIRITDNTNIVEFSDLIIDDEEKESSEIEKALQEPPIGAEPYWSAANKRIEELSGAIFCHTNTNDFNQMRVWAEEISSLCDMVDYLGIIANNEEESK